MSSPRAALRLAVDGLAVVGVGVGVLLAGLGTAEAQDHATAACRSELIDPVPAATGAGRARRAMTEILVEIIDPFEGSPPAAPRSTTTEIVDPFRAGRIIMSEILDPWAS